MKKQNLALLLLSSTMLLSCGVKEEPSQSSQTPNSSDTSATPDTSVIPAPFEKTLEEIKDNILATAYKGYSFLEKSDKTVEGTVTLGTKSILVKGNANFEEENVPNMIYYRGIQNNVFYDIENFSARKATKQNVVAAPKEGEIKEETAIQRIAEAPYTASWITEDVLSLFDEKNVITSSKAQEEKEGYFVSLEAYLGGTTTAKADLSFSKEDKLETVDFTKSVWDADEFDSETKTPIDPDAKPASKTSKKGTLVLGDISDETFDVTPYFVTSVPTFYVSSEDNIKENNGKATVGKSIHLEIETYLPNTALNDNDIQIVESSNTDIIDKNILGIFEAKKKGSCTLTISDSLRSFTETIQMEVVTPPLTSLWLTANNGKEVEIDKTLDLKVEFYDANSEEEFEAVSSNESVVSIVGFSADRKTLTIKGLAIGTSDISLKNMDGSIVSRKVTITVKEKSEGPSEETAWLIGTWEGDEDVYNTTMIFNSDGTGKYKQTGTSYFNFGWRYVASTKTLSFPKDEWKAPRMGIYKVIVNPTKTEIRISWDDPYEDNYIEEHLTKVK